MFSLQKKSTSRHLLDIYWTLAGICLEITAAEIEKKYDTNLDKD